MLFLSEKINTSKQSFLDKKPTYLGISNGQDGVTWSNPHTKRYNYCAGLMTSLGVKIWSQLVNDNMLTL